LSHNNCLTRTNHRIFKNLENHSQLIFGRKPILDALKNGKELDKVLVINNLRGEFEIKLRELSKKYQFSIQRVPQEKLDKLTKNQNHQGIIAYVSALLYFDFEDLLPKLAQAKTDPLILILDGIEDVRNLGAIARSAYAFDVDVIVTLMRGNARINDVAIKTSAGGLLNIPVCRVENLSDALSLLSENGIRIMASSLQTEEVLQDMELSGGIAVVIGSEESGISKITSGWEHWSNSTKLTCCCKPFNSICYKNTSYF